MTRLERIKEQLTKMGFEGRLLECDAYCDGYSCDNCEPMWEVSYEGDGDQFDWVSQSPTEDLAWENALTLVLADKSLTGARMDDLLRSVDPNDEVRTMGLIAEVALFAIATMTYDESVAKKWRGAFIDTEEQ